MCIRLLPTHFFVFILSATFVSSACAQKGVTTFGFQVKPVFSSRMLNAGVQEVVNNGVGFAIDLRSGLVGGMVVRRGITDRISFETGINYVKRKFNLTITDNDFAGTSSFRFVGYEIPLLGLVYLQMSKQSFINAALGTSLDVFPSDIYSYDNYFRHYATRKSWILPGVLANMGYEYRSAHSGYFYLGASYQRSFSDIAYSHIEYDRGPGHTADTHIKLRGNYLTIDFRYFFHEASGRKE